MTPKPTGGCPYCTFPIAALAWSVVTCPKCHKPSIAATDPKVGPGDDFLPVFLGNWRITGPAPQGGMGRVFQAVGPGGSTVAVKFPLLEQSAGTGLLERFAREIAILSGVKSNALAAYLGHGEEAGCPFVVMEWVPGKTWRRFWRQFGRGGRFCPLETIQRLPGASDRAAGRPARRSIIHRDVKPGNIIATPSGGFKLVDLGIARFAENDPDGETKATSVMGTREYAAPELLAGRATDARADIYSLGVVAFEMITGRKPRDNSTRPSAAYAREVRHGSTTSCCE